MAIITILISSFIGFVAGAVQVLLLGGTVWQGAMTYLGTSAGLSLFVAFTAFAAHQIRAAGQTVDPYSGQDTLDDWYAWHEAEDWADAEKDDFEDVEITPNKRSA